MMGKFKGGSIMLAMQAGLPIVPISVIGSRHVMKKGELTTRPGHVTVIVHDPIDTPANAEPSVHDVREFANRVREVIRPSVEAEASRSTPQASLSPKR
jgi:1-acyl-sn-glycerol-3-phosphate acyltransferase